MITVIGQDPKIAIEPPDAFFDDHGLSASGLHILELCNIQKPPKNKRGYIEVPDNEMPRYERLFRENFDAFNLIDEPIHDILLNEYNDREVRNEVFELIDRNEFLQRYLEDNWLQVRQRLVEHQYYDAIVLCGKHATWAFCKAFAIDESYLCKYNPVSITVNRIQHSVARVDHPSPANHKLYTQDCLERNKTAWRNILDTQNLPGARVIAEEPLRSTIA
ncbi:MAG: hypothetical protein EPN75_07620 [Beijerinckiaceae bacterium]|nr:MAG: hypothetical protein EPN75_07620 [Beijerinckiaceae bacterium]